jgi:hypothetical protein
MVVPPAPLTTANDDLNDPLLLGDGATNSDDEYWGVTRHDDATAPSLPRFPATVEEVTDGMVRCLSAVLQGDHQRADPAVVRNALSGDRVTRRRPVRGPWDAGRIGVEVAGRLRHAPAARGRRTDVDGAVIRHVALRLAAKLSKHQWKNGGGGGSSSSTTDDPSSTPVVVYFTTVTHALAACKELQRLKHLSSDSTSYDRVTISCLSQGNGLPEVLIQGKSPPHRGLTKGLVDPERGLVIVVQPTDYQREFPPPGPVVDVVAALQRLSAQAAIQQVPVILLSPRFLAQPSHSLTGWDQAGYQKSSPYGGREPPTGPTPWILRDFSPPCFSWIGQAADELSLFHSVAIGHEWHIHTDDGRYVASCGTQQGRPPRDLLRRLYDRFLLQS